MAVWRQPDGLENAVPWAGVWSTTAESAGGGVGLQEKHGAIAREGKRRRGEAIIGLSFSVHAYGLSGGRAPHAWAMVSRCKMPVICHH